MGAAILDRFSYAIPYAPGLFGALSLLPPATVRFGFFKDVDTLVTVLDGPRLRRPFADPRGVRRPAGLTSRLRVATAKPRA